MVMILDDNPHQEFIPSVSSIDCPSSSSADSCDECYIIGLPETPEKEVACLKRLKGGNALKGQFQKKLNSTLIALKDPLTNKKMKVR